MKRKVSDYIDDEAEDDEVEDNEWDDSGESNWEDFIDDSEELDASEESQLIVTREPIRGTTLGIPHRRPPVRKLPRVREAEEPIVVSEDDHPEPPVNKTRNNSVQEGPAKYRANRKKFFLTYPRCPATPEQILAHLSAIGTIAKYLIAVENHHAEGEIPTHIHAFIEFESKRNFTNARWADWTAPDGSRYHPNDGGNPRNDVCVAKYCTKEGVYISNYWTRSIWESALQAKDYSTAVGLIRDNYAKEYWLNGDKIHSMAARLHYARTTPKFRIEDFKRPRLDDRLTWLIWGSTGTGKTNFALAHFKNPLKVEHLDALKMFDPTMHDGIVFDDIDFRHLPITTVIHLLDRDYGQWIHCRYYNGFIPGDTKRMFCFNTDNPFYVVDGDGTGLKVTSNSEQVQAIERRIARVQVMSKLF